MRKIVMFNLISIDGFFAGSDGNIDWHKVDEEFEQFAIEQTKSFGGLIFGRTTYDLFESYWPKVLVDPKASSEDRQIGQAIDETWKFVYSKTLQEVNWKNTKLLHEINPDEVKSWKQYDGKDLAIFGSGQIVDQYSKLGLIDEYRFMVNPVVLGEGKTLFSAHLEMNLVSSRQFKNGNILLTYIPATQKGN